MLKPWVIFYILSLRIFTLYPFRFKVAIMQLPYHMVTKYHALTIKQVARIPNNYLHGWLSFATFYVTSSVKLARLHFIFSRMIAW